MPRQRDPYGDPVKLQLRHKWLRIRYYPTGLITDPADRVWYDGKWDPNDPQQVAQATSVSERIRAELYQHRAAAGIEHQTTQGVTVTVSMSVAKFLESQPELTPAGTLKAYASRLNIMLSDPYGSRPIADLSLLAEAIVTQIGDAVHRSKGTPLVEGTRSGRISALTEYGRWVARTYSTADPFAEAIAPTEATRKAQREKRYAKAHDLAQRLDPFVDGDEDESIDPRQLPLLADVVALRDAIIRRESQGSPVRPSAGRGSGGGTPPLATEIAAQFAELTTFAAASGLRLCEVLGTHTSRIDTRRMIMIVDRQLNRHRKWLPGEPPPLAPPKHSKMRRVQIWPAFGTKLGLLVAFADERNDGWLFPPTRNQGHWADAVVNAVERAADMLAWEYEQSLLGATPLSARRQWTWNFHWLRHLYASHSLARKEAGGLGWSIDLVQESLGHQSDTTTRRIYKHIVDEERRAARGSAQSWVGL
jgi:integrase